MRRLCHHAGPSGVTTFTVHLTPRIVLPPSPATAKYACSDSEPPFSVTHAFAHWAFVLVRDGHGTVEHAGHRFEIVPGTLICSPPGFVRIDLSPGTELMVISLEERGSARGEMWKPFAVPLVRRLDAQGVARWTERLATVERKVRAGALVDADVRALKRSFMENFWLDARASSQRIVHEAFAVLHREMDSISSLDALASNLGYTRNHVSDTMRDLTGASLSAWLIGMRMARAREVLAADNVPIADVGAAIGYDDAAYFSRAFRRYHGVPPHHWRIAHRPGDERHSEIVIDKERVEQAASNVA